MLDLKDEVTDQLSIARSNVRSRAISAAEQADAIASRMTRLAEALRKNPRSAPVNDLGELQGNGPALDVAVAKLYAARDALTMIERLATALREGSPE